MPDPAAAFAALPPADRMRISLLAVAVEPVSRTRLGRLAKLAVAQHRHIGKVGAPSLKRVAVWVSAGLVHDDESELTIDDKLVDTAMHDAVHTMTLASLCAAADKELGQWGVNGDIRALRWHLFGFEHKSPYRRPDKSPHPETLRRALGWFPSKHNLAKLTDEMRAVYLKEMAEVATEHTIALPATVLAAAHDALDASARKPPWIGAMAEYYALRGELDNATSLLAGHDSLEACAAMVMVHTVAGNYDAARAAGDKCLEKQQRRKRKSIPELSGPIWACLCLAHDDPEQRARAITLSEVASEKESDEIHEVYKELKPVMYPGKHAIQPSEVPPADYMMRRWKPLFFEHLVARWRGASISKKRAVSAGHNIDRARQEGFNWLVEQWTATLGHESAAKQTHLRLLMRPKPAWEEALDSIEALCAVPAKATKAATERLVWRIHLVGTEIRAEPRLQKRTKNSWTTGRTVALRRLIANEVNANANAHWLTDADRRVAMFVHEHRESWRGRTDVELLTPAVALIGHPLVFWASGDDTDPVELVRATPQLEVKSKDGALMLRLVPTPQQNGAPLAFRESAARVRVVSFSDKQLRLAESLGEGLTVPREASDRVASVIGQAAQIVPLQSDIDVTGSDAVERAPESQTYVQLWRRGHGLRLRLCVFPLGRRGPSFAPGDGAAQVSANVGTEHLRCTRSLSEEQCNLDAVVDTCPTLAIASQDGRDYHIADLEDCLELLLELGAHPSVVMEWPAGTKFTVSDRRGAKALRVQVRSDRGWLLAEGQLRIDEDRVVEMKQLLRAVSTARGRFIELGDDQYLALTTELRQRLRELDAFAVDHAADGPVKLHALAATAVDGLREAGVELTATRAAKTSLARLRQAHELSPKVSARFECELRDYQQQGYEWMTRLAHWGAGACLADDMGLGKTVQALALLVDRAEHGPALVVAPTSVCANWQTEAVRFAPTLRPHLFADRKGTARKKLIKEAGAHDVVLVSYALLVQANKLLAGRRWGTLILDEAQAIKNARTQRARAARSIDAEFRLATTGTPVENHVGDLWSLFAVLNPGLLGNKDSFEARFATPIHRHGDRDAAQRLRQLVRPFMLRRRKSEVLTELPPRTETTLRVQMHADERTLYEAARREAVSRLEGTPGTKQRLQIFAELMRLRRGACHPELLAPGCGFASAKHDALDTLLADLLAGGHRALVFSQFVGHLALVRERLDERGITYQYLDGSTPAGARHKRVNAFQAGAGDLFLISLKAGGTGLNLTGADYVIHLDPWWNPAVEDQASDRAHRIGQSRPVTVYRLVSAGTIEDKIVALHGEKRELADRILAGTEHSARMSPEALLALLREDD